MFETIFGAEMPLALRFFVAFIIVLGLIGGTAYVVRRFGATRLGAGAARGRQPRLAVIDAASVDGRRRLVLIRRDNVEHLLMIGGPSDLVVEPNIVRAAAPREAPPPRPPAATDTLPRPVPLGEGNMWPLQPHAEPAPTPPAPRPQRPPPPPPQVQEEPAPWPIEAEAQQPAPPRPPKPVDPLAGLAAELARVTILPSEPGAPPPRPVREREAAREPVRERQRVEPRPEARAEPRPDSWPEPRPEPQPERAAEAPFGASADQNLAEMAQRLEAALRRPGKVREQRPVAAEHPPAPVTQSEPASEPPPSEPQPARTEAPAMDGPRLESRRMEVPRIDGKGARAEQKTAPKSLYDSLEQEMASLLGRPNSKP